MTVGVSGDVDDGRTDAGPGRRLPLTSGRVNGCQSAPERLVGELSTTTARSQLTASRVDESASSDGTNAWEAESFDGDPKTKRWSALSSSMRRDRQGNTDEYQLVGTTRTATESRTWAKSLDLAELEKRRVLRAEFDDAISRTSTVTLSPDASGRTAPC